jgi:hypothetical protein
MGRAITATRRIPFVRGDRRALEGIARDAGERGVVPTKPPSVPLSAGRRGSMCSHTK